jgi:nitrate/TMAO reductase-like tetraheme cytochrome c subunit
MKLSACVDCHSTVNVSKKPGSLRSVITLSHAHQLNGVSCTDCHGEKRPAESPDNQKCIPCHSDYKKGIVRTDKSLPNMHDSHMGDLDCMLCHHVHTKSENFCSQCHWWKYRVP